MLQAAGVGKSTDPLSERSRRLARELEDFVSRGMQGIMATEIGEEGAPSVESATELQIQIARMFRQIFPGNKELLYLITEKNWMALLLNWMNQYDRPKVQVEAMLSLTCVTDLCQQQFYQNPTSGVELSPFSTGMESMHNPFRRPGSNTGPNPIHIHVQSNNASKDVSKGLTHSNTTTIQSELLPESIAHRVKNIMSQAKDSTTSVSNILVKQTTEGGKKKTTIVQQTTMVSNTSAVNSLLSQAITQSTGNVASSEKDPSNDSYVYRSGIVTKPDGKSADDKDTNVENHDENGKQLEKDSKAEKRSPSAPLTIPYRKGGRIEELMKGAQQNRPPMPLPAKNLPPMPTGNGSSPIPLVSNYTQPLSVTSNNLLVRHPEAIPSFISLMTSPDKDVCENAMWVVGNIATGEGSGVPGSSAGGSNGSGLGDIGDKSPSVTVKDIVLAAGAMGPLLRCMERFQDSLSLQRIGSWVISTLVENKLPPGKKSNSNGNGENSRIEDIDLDQLLNTVRRVIQSDDGDILSYTCWSLSHLCDGPASNIAAVVTSADEKDPLGGLVPRLVELLHHTNWRVTKPALRTIGNIVCAEYDEDAANALDDKPLLTDFTEVILECDAVPRLKSLINHCNREIQKEACWTLSNIAAGTVDQIQAVIDSGAIPPLVSLVNDETTDQEVRSEACWVVLNATSCGSDAQIGVLVTEGCVSVLGLLLEETNMVTMALEGLERVLQVEELREAAWRESQKLGISSDPPTPLVSASLIEKALNKNHKSNVTKRAQKIWNEHFVSCALCNQPYSKHRVTDAKFCEECKCHVCHNCNCEVYHLSYQEELWATPDEKKSGKAKKSKNKKKKEKRKEKNKMKAQETKVVNTEKTETQASSDSNATTKSKTEEEDDDTKVEFDSTISTTAGKDLLKAIVRHKHDNGELKDGGEGGKRPKKIAIPAIDYNLYLQETGSIIAVSNLMDALDQIQDIRGMHGKPQKK